MAGGAALLAITASLAANGSVPRWEWRVFDATNGLPAWLWPAAWLPMQFGSYAVTPLLAVWALAARRRRLAVELMLAGTAGYLGAKLMKSIVERPRPGVLADVNLRGIGTEGGGFPSGHAATATALAFVLFAWLPRRWGWSVVALAAVVATLRVYTGAHLPLDVVGGAGLGVAVAALTTWASKVPNRDGA